MSEFINGMLISIAICVPMSVIIIGAHLFVLLATERLEPSPPKSPIARHHERYTVD